MLRDIFPNFASHIVGDGGDAPIFAWNLWWVKRALIDLKTTPLYTDYIFYPTGSSLIYHTLTITNGLISIPLQYFFNLTQTFNLVVLINFVLSGLFTYLLCRKINLDQIASILAGLIFALAPNIVAQTIGHTNLYSVWYIPAALLFTIILVEKPSPKSALFLALTFALGIYSDYYVACYGAILVVLYGFIFLISRQDKDYKRIGLWGMVMIAVTLMLISPILVQFKSAGRSLRLPAITNEEYGLYSGDLAGFTTPSFLNRAGEAEYYKQKLHNLPGSEGVNYLGLLPIVLGGLAIVLVFMKKQPVKRHFVVFAVLGAVICLLLSLGPKVYYLDEPYALNFGWLYMVMSKMPILKNLRVPIRFITPAMLCLAMLAGYVVTYANSQLTKLKLRSVGYLAATVIGIVSLMIIIGEYQTHLWTYDATIPAVYEKIAADKDDVIVMELPFRQKTGRGWEIGKGFSKQQLAQTIHGKKLLSGYISFADENVKSAPLSQPGVHYLATNLSDQTSADQNSELARAGMSNFKIRYVIVSKSDDFKGSWYKMDQNQADKADSYIKTILQGQVVAEDGLNTIYQIPGI